MKNQLIGTSRENNIVLLGSQGPFVFFYGFSFLRLDGYIGNPAFEYYSLLTKQSIYETFTIMFNYIRKETDKSKREVLLNYVRGYLNGYAFSRNTQPFIYYFGGYEKSDSPWDTYSLARYSLETKLDILYEQSIRESTTFKSIFRISKEDLSVISEMFYNLAIDVYSLMMITKKTFSDSYHEMRNRLAISNNESGFLFGVFLKLLKKEQVNVFMRGKRVEDTDKFDFLNLRKKKWQHPSEGFEIDITFLDLVEEAKEEIPFINSILKNLKAGKDVDRALLEFCMNLNYCGFPINSEPSFFDDVPLERKDD